MLGPSRLEHVHHQGSQGCKHCITCVELPREAFASASYDPVAARERFVRAYTDPKPWRSDEVYTLAPPRRSGGPRGSRGLEVLIPTKTTGFVTEKLEFVGSKLWHVSRTHGIRIVDEGMLWDLATMDLDMTMLKKRVDSYVRRPDLWKRYTARYWKLKVKKREVMEREKWATARIQALERRVFELETAVPFDQLLFGRKPPSHP